MSLGYFHFPFIPFKCLKIILTQFFGKDFFILSAHSTRTIFLGLKLFPPSPNLKFLFRCEFCKHQNDKNFQSRFFAILFFQFFDFLNIIKVGLFIFSFTPIASAKLAQLPSSRSPNPPPKPKPKRRFPRAFQPKFLLLTLARIFLTLPDYWKQTFSSRIFIKICKCCRFFFQC